MDTCHEGRRGGAGSSGGWLTADEARLVPIVARAAELGRGPPWLVGWVSARVAQLGGSDGGTRSFADPAVTHRLARELARLVRPRGLAETVPDRAGGRRRAGSSCAPLPR